MKKGEKLTSKDLYVGMDVILVRMDGGEYIRNIDLRYIDYARQDLDNHICEMYSIPTNNDNLYLDLNTFGHYYGDLTYDGVNQKFKEVIGEKLYNSLYSKITQWKEKQGID